MCVCVCVCVCVSVAILAQAKLVRGARVIPNLNAKGLYVVACRTRGVVALGQSSRLGPYPLLPLSSSPQSEEPPRSGGRSGIPGPISWAHTSPQILLGEHQLRSLDPSSRGQRRHQHPPAPPIVVEPPQAHSVVPIQGRSPPRRPRPSRAEAGTHIGPVRPCPSAASCRSHGHSPPTHQQ